MGAKPFIYVTNADLLKEIMVKQFGNFTDKVCIYNQQYIMTIKRVSNCPIMCYCNSA